MSWNTIHNGNRVEGSDVDSHFIYKNSDGSKIDGSIEDAVDAMSQINGFGVLAKQASTNSLFSSSKIIKDCLNNRGVQPSCSSDFDYYPTGTISIAASCEDSRENPDYISGGNGGIDQPTTSFRYMFKMHLVFSINNKLPYNLIIPFSLFNLKVDNTLTGYEVDEHVIVPTGNSSVDFIEYVYANVLMTETMLIDFNVEIKEISGGGTMQVPQYLVALDSSIKVITATSSWQLQYTGKTCNEDPLYANWVLMNYYGPKGLSCTGGFNTVPTYLNPVDGKYYSANHGSSFVVDGCYATSNSTSSGATFNFFKFVSGVRTAGYTAVTCENMMGNCPL